MDSYFFFKPGVRVKKIRKLTLGFVSGGWIHVHIEVSSFHPPTSDLWCFITITMSMLHLCSSSESVRFKAINVSTSASVSLQISLMGFFSRSQCFCSFLSSNSDGSCYHINCNKICIIFKSLLLFTFVFSKNHPLDDCICSADKEVLLHRFFFSVFD